MFCRPHFSTRLLPIPPWFLHRPSFPSPRRLSFLPFPSSFAHAHRALFSSRLESTPAILVPFPLRSPFTSVHNEGRPSTASNHYPRQAQHHSTRLATLPTNVRLKRSTTKTGLRYPVYPQVPLHDWSAFGGSATHDAMEAGTYFWVSSVLRLSFCRAGFSLARDVVSRRSCIAVRAMPSIMHAFLIAVYLLRCVPSACPSHFGQHAQQTILLHVEFADVSNFANILIIRRFSTGGVYPAPSLVHDAVALDGGGMHGTSHSAAITSIFPPTL
ncbi:hypothetical protein B0H12DRAFT_1243446 [Mycena haematopus]|nr:hypothetical protein B0H12DRAFT_1243446 [Mycena haematopus]